MDNQLYRLAAASTVPDDAWKARLQWTTAYTGVAELDDKFIQLLTAEQVIGASEAHFGGRADVVLLRFSVDVMRYEADLSIRWEDAESASGAFPHVYGGAIPYACLYAPPALLALGSDGKHVFPPLGAEAVAAAAAAEAAATSGLKDDAGALDAERGFLDDDGYDGGAARGMWG
jgi:uncharacterized protein (DUF952 family)